MPRARAQRPTATRKIYFFRADGGSDEGGRPLPYDPAPALNHIQGLDFAPGGGPDSNYMLGADDSVTYCWVDRANPAQRLRLGDIRRRYLPRVEEEGRLTDLPIRPTAGIAEEVHVVFFDNNIVGSEFNFYGPRISRLRRYLSVKTGDVGVVPFFEPLLRNDIREQLERMEDVRLFDLKIRASWVETVRQADEELGAAFDAGVRAGHAEELEIVLKSRAYSRTPIAERLLRTARQLLATDDARTEALRFVVKGLSEETGRVETVDLLSDKLISSQQIVLANERTRTLDSESAYAAIQLAYNELREELERAAGVDAEAIVAA